jgi:hypothetical protein
MLYLCECKKTELDSFYILLSLNDTHRKMEKTGYSKRSMNIQILKIIPYEYLKRKTEKNINYKILMKSHM